MHRRVVERMKTMAVCIVLSMVATQSIGLQAFAWKVKLSREVIENHNLKYDRIQILSQGGIKRCASDALEVWVHKEYPQKIESKTIKWDDETSCNHALERHKIYLKFLDKKFGIKYKKKLLMFIKPRAMNDPTLGYVFSYKSTIFIQTSLELFPMVHLHELSHMYQIHLARARNSHFINDFVTSETTRFFAEGLAVLITWEFRENFAFHNEKKYFHDRQGRQFPINTMFPREMFTMGTETRKRTFDEMIFDFQKYKEGYPYAFLVMRHFNQLAQKRNKKFNIHVEFLAMSPSLLAYVAPRGNIVEKFHAKKIFDHITKKHLGMSLEEFEISFKKGLDGRT